MGKLDLLQYNYTWTSNFQGLIAKCALRRCLKLHESLFKTLKSCTQCVNLRMHDVLYLIVTFFRVSNAVSNTKQSSVLTRKTFII